MKIAAILGFIAIAATWLGIIVGGMIAMVTHIVACIKASAWILLAFGVFVPPIGIIHGIGLWLGAF